MMSIGSLGLISVASNVCPKEVGDVARLYFAGKNQEATELQERLYKEISKCKNKRAVKNVCIKIRKE